MLGVTAPVASAAASVTMGVVSCFSLLYWVSLSYISLSIVRTKTWRGVGRWSVERKGYGRGHPDLRVQLNAVACVT